MSSELVNRKVVGSKPSSSNNNDNNSANTAIKENNNEKAQPNNNNEMRLLSVSISDAVFSSINLLCAYYCYKSVVQPQYIFSTTYNSDIFTIIKLHTLLQFSSFGYILFSIAGAIGVIRFLGYNKVIPLHEYLSSVAGAGSLLFIGISYFFWTSNKSSRLPSDSLFSCILLGLIFFHMLFRILFRPSFMHIFTTAGSIIGSLCIFGRCAYILFYENSRRLQLGSILGLLGYITILISAGAGVKGSMSLTSSISILRVNFFHYGMSIASILLCMSQNQLFVV